MVVGIILVILGGGVAVLYQGKVIEKLADRIEDLARSSEDQKRDSLAAMNLLTEQLTDSEANREHLAKEHRDLQEDHSRLSEDMDGILRYLEQDRERLSVLEKIIRKVISLGADGSLNPSLLRTGVIRQADNIFEVFHSTLICLLTISPSEDYGVEGRVHPIAIYNDGNLYPPLVNPQTGIEDWELAFDLMGDLNIEGMGDVTVSSVTACWSGENYSIAGLVYSASNPGFDELPDSMPSADCTETCENRFGFELDTVIAPVTSTRLFRFPRRDDQSNRDTWRYGSAERQEQDSETVNDSTEEAREECSTICSFSVSIEDHQIGISFEARDSGWKFQLAPRGQDTFNYNLSGCIGLVE